MAHTPHHLSHDYAKNFPFVVKWALALNLLTFVVEIIAGFYSNSLALIFDSIDSLGDSLNYAIAIYVLSKPLKFQSLSAIIKAVCMMSFGIYMLGNGIYQITISGVPIAHIMIKASILSLIINVTVTYMLYKFRDGSSNQKSVWLCSRNDAINNILTIIAGILVAKFNSKWPDLVVAGIMGFLTIYSAIEVLKEARKELNSSKRKP
jgi:Co/Zn/Cd efflux system component